MAHAPKLMMQDKRPANAGMGPKDMALGSARRVCVAWASIIAFFFIHPLTLTTAAGFYEEHDLELDEDEAWASITAFFIPDLSDKFLKLSWRPQRPLHQHAGGGAEPRGLTSANLRRLQTCSTEGSTRGRHNDTAQGYHRASPWR